MSTSKPARELNGPVYLKIDRPEGYEDVHPEIVRDDFVANPKAWDLPEVTGEPDLAPGILKAIEMLRSKDAFEYWRKCGNAEVVKGMIVSPNKNDWASWIESEAKRLGLLKGDE